jgi:probable rRNA maturation factor
VDVIVEAGDWAGKAVLTRLARKAIAAAARLADPGIAPDAELAVIFTDDRHIRGLNRRFRRKDKPTNVLSFPAAPAKNGRLGPLLGDIVLGHETVAREAEDAGLEIAAHATHLIVHGFLHLVGYDHMAGGEAVVMERLETAILQSIGVADPYERAPRGPARRQPKSER